MLAVNTWYIVAVNKWIILAVNAWYITGRKLTKDTVSAWLYRASQHVEAVSRYLMVNLHFEAVQLDEFWSFVKKKKLNARLSSVWQSSMATTGSG